ncbi:MAG: formylmethanofuran dehydrogenase subunit B [Candidatus Syntrophoarchaeum sp. GoM_oil]|nr:MAG: formylmethanofuran dehydrogenase subunit B [Candidatus Syntrophoarchaeum sp. GoM_oil]
MATETITDVVCPLCGCLCDDIEVIVEDGKISNVKKACPLGKNKIMGHHRIEAPMVRENGRLKEVSYDEVIERSAKILAEAKRPLLYGWASLISEAQRKGVELGEELGAVIDTTASVCHGPTVLGVQGRGAPGCTLGQVKNRADLIIYWGCNPQEAHPRHRARYTHGVKGRFRPGGKKDRKLFVIDVRETKTSKVADEFVKIDPGYDYMVFSALRTILAGHADVVPDTVGGIPKAKLVEMVDAMKSCEFGTIFGGMGLTHTRCRYKNLENVISLVDELNAHTKFTLIPMRGHYNVNGSGHTLAWLTGYPFAVDFSRGYAWYNPGETTSNDLLMRGEVDAMMAIAGDPGAHFPGRSLKHMAKIPLIQIDPYANPTTELADVVIPTAVSGVEVAGTAYRMDGVPIRTRKVVDTDFLTDEEILDRILARVKELKGGN